jgi:NAD(P)-dependent dehydrogenase (short-subunit alcohol dehydrogenase family)
MPDDPNRGVDLITGASTGIGRACAEHLDSLGFAIFAGVRKQSDADSLSGAGSGRTQPLMLDVTESESIASAMRTVEEAAVTDVLRLELRQFGIQVAAVEPGRSSRRSGGRAAPAPSRRTCRPRL